MWRGLSGGERDLACLVIEQPLISIRLKTIWPASLLRIKELAGQIIHDFRISIRREDITEALLRYVSDVESLPLLVEQETARGDQSVA